MEKKIVVVTLMMVMLLGQAAASFDQCYAACYFDCILDMRKLFPIVPKKFLPCGWKCAKHCIFHPASTSLYYCNLGCSVESCSDVYDDGVKMGSCVDNCNNNYCSKKD
ncbi:hypothetical protein ACOSQ4_020841 [Xanthoceras sorbifolium]